MGPQALLGSMGSQVRPPAGLAWIHGESWTCGVAVLTSHTARAAGKQLLALGSFAHDSLGHSRVEVWDMGCSSWSSLVPANTEHGGLDAEQQIPVSISPNHSPSPGCGWLRMGSALC